MTESLILASMKNNITDPTELNKIRNLLKGDYKISVGTDQKNLEAQQTLNKLLSDTNKKRACCLNKRSIDVRIPLPIDISPDNSEIGQNMKKYGFYDRLVTDIPIDKPGFCTFDGKNFSKNNENCDDFFNVYCKNIINEYKSANNGKFDAGDFSNNYKPECACHMPIPSWVESMFKASPIPKCVLPGCDPNLNVYLDSASRAGQCNQTICTANVQIGAATASQDAAIISNINQNCGDSSGGKPITVENPIQRPLPPIKEIPMVPTQVPIKDEVKSETELVSPYILISGSVFVSLIILILLAIIMYFIFIKK